MTNKYTRRNFSKIISAASAGMITAPWLGCETKPKGITIPDKKLGILLVGLGYYSTDLLAPALQLTQHCELRGICTGSPEKISTWQEKHNIPDANVYNYENLHTVADNNDIDVVYVVVPTGLHMKYSLIAADAGKHVWCEKPMAMNVEQCQQIIDACNKNKVKLSIGYRIQHDPNMKEIIKLGEEKPFGSIVSAFGKAGYQGGEPGGWRADKELGGGALYDMGVYTINGLRHALHLEPTAVISASHDAMHTEVDTTTSYQLEFPDGVIGNGWTSVIENQNRLDVTCESGSYYLEPMQAYNGLKYKRSDGDETRIPVENQQTLQMDADALAIINNTNVLAPGIDGLRDVRIVNAILESIAIGGRVEIS